MKRFSQFIAENEVIEKRMRDVRNPPSGQQVVALRRYEKGSTFFNRSLMKAHERGEPHDTYLSHGEKKVYNHLQDVTSQPIGVKMHLMHGAGFNARRVAKQNGGLVHMPGFTSLTHSKADAHYFASDRNDGSPGNHVVHVHLKPTDKAYHGGNIMSKEATDETILPAGTTLRHTRSSYDKKNKTFNHHFVVHSQE